MRRRTRLDDSRRRTRHRSGKDLALRQFLSVLVDLLLVRRKNDGNRLRAVSFHQVGRQRCFRQLSHHLSGLWGTGHAPVHVLIFHSVNLRRVFPLLQMGWHLVFRQFNRVHQNRFRQFFLLLSTFRFQDRLRRMLLNHVSRQARQRIRQFRLRRGRWSRRTIHEHRTDLISLSELLCFHYYLLLMKLKMYLDFLARLCTLRKSRNRLLTLRVS